MKVKHDGECASEGVICDMCGGSTQVGAGHLEFGTMHASG